MEAGYLFNCVEVHCSAVPTSVRLDCAHVSVRARQRRMGAFTATTPGHLEERKQEMPDVHQPDLSLAGEPEEKPGVPPPPPNAS